MKDILVLIQENAFNANALMRCTEFYFWLLDQLLDVLTEQISAHNGEFASADSRCILETGIKIHTGLFLEAV